jgi:SAM-dependent methyltransferase
MASESWSTSGKDVFEHLNIDYEHAYGHNPLKRSCLEESIALLAPGSRVLDLGCGTGIPVSQMLSEAGMSVVGIDVSPKMTELAEQRVRGDFRVGDIASTEPPEGQFDAIFLIFAQLQLSYAAMHGMCYRFAKCLKPGGLFVVGQAIAGSYMKTAADESFWDETKTYVEGIPATFWGNPIREFAMGEDGLKRFPRSMGLEVVEEVKGWFQPRHEACAAEHQQYVIAKRVGEAETTVPEPRPKEP